MFTGIVRERGRVESVEERGETVRLVVRAPATAEQAVIGDSVSLAGVCLTAVEISDGSVAFDAVPETLRRSTLGRLAPGAEVNVEPALRAGEPLGGHIVQGHVDDLGTVASLEREGEGARLEIGAAESIVRYCVEKGSITVDGVSLTVNAVADQPDGSTHFAVNVIPHTAQVTTLGRLAQGDAVNIEIDVLARYLGRMEELRRRVADVGQA